MSLYIEFETFSLILKIYVGLSILSILWFTYSYSIYIKCNPNKLKNIDHSRFDFCKRLDYENISLFYSIIGSILYCPIRISILSFTTFSILLVLFVLKLIGTLFPWVRGFILYNSIHVLIVRFVGVFTLRLLGIKKVNHYILEKNVSEDSGLIKYSCVKSRDPPTGDDIVTIVSNHVSILDISFFMRYVSCGFVAQKEIRENFILGTVADIIGCIYVDRSCMETRSKAKHFIQDRQLKRLHLINSMKNQINNSIKINESESLSARNKTTKCINSLEKTPLVIFPEGTTTNGNDIIPFKLGAFESLTPITPVVLSYSYSAYSPAFDIIPFWVLMCLLLCNYGEITISAYWLPQMHAVSTQRNETSIKDFANRVRELMIKVLRKAKDFEEISELQTYRPKEDNYQKNNREGFDIFIDLDSDCSNSITTGSLRLKQEYIRMFDD